MGVKKTKTASGFKQGINIAEVFLQFVRVQTVQERLFVGQSEKRLPEEDCRLLHVRVAPDFPAFFRLPYDFLPKLIVQSENPLDFLPDVRIVHAHLREEMEVIGIQAAIMRAVVVANQFENPFHGSGDPRHVLPDKFRQRIGGGRKLVSRFVYLQHILVRHGNEQIQLVREIIDDARLGQSAGSGKRSVRRLWQA